MERLHNDYDFTLTFSNHFGRLLLTCFICLNPQDHWGNPVSHLDIWPSATACTHVLQHNIEKRSEFHWLVHWKPLLCDWSIFSNVYYPTLHSHMWQVHKVWQVCNMQNQVFPLCIHFAGYVFTFQYATLLSLDTLSLSLTSCNSISPPQYWSMNTFFSYAV